MRGFGGVILLIIIVVAMFFRQAIGLYVDWLWFQDVGYAAIFTTILSYKTVLGASAGAIFALLLYVNLKIASSATAGVRYSGVDNIIELPALELIDPMFKRLLLPAVLVVGVMAAAQGALQWEEALFFLNSVSFNMQDPQFGHDMGFYIFRLPMLRVFYHWVMFALGLSAAATAAVYLLYRGIEYTPRGLFLGDRARNHLLVLFGLLLLAKAGGYYLDAFDLLHSRRGFSHGAAYADVYGNLPALRVLIFLALIAAALCFTQIYRTGYKFVVLGVGAVVAVHLLGLNVYPALLQRFRVTPNEIEAERPFIERTIKNTRFAFGLDKIETKDFPAEEQLTAGDLKRNESTINNIRLWDHRPLLTTYAQLQEIRPYYKFVDVDNDRYMIDGIYRQVMLSARELSHQHLQSRNWINEHLTFTHGHGVVFGPVNHVTSSGQPEFFIKDIPPTASTSVKVARPEIYFGELANEYVLVRTKAQELDYPSGDQNIYTTYKGQRGVAIGSLWRQLVFSAHHGSLRILLAQDLTAESRILYHRAIQERVKKIAPFIIFDRDAYLVIAQGGRLFWIVDGYTTSDRFPYSEPLRQQDTNYIRNAVKVVVDAYEGTVTFHLTDARDPVIQA